MSAAGLRQANWVSIEAAWTWLAIPNEKQIKKYKF